MIGIFDSGIGGLTVVRSLMKQAFFGEDEHASRIIYTDWKDAAKAGCARLQTSRGPVPNAAR